MKTYIALTAAALVSAVALGQEEARSPPATPNAVNTPPPASESPAMVAIFDKLDTNHDGKISPEEAQAEPTVSTNFASADTNHDGAVSKEEFLVAFKPRSQ
jgi:EF hand